MVALWVTEAIKLWKYHIFITCICIWYICILNFSHQIHSHLKLQMITISTTLEEMQILQKWGSRGEKRRVNPKYWSKTCQNETCVLSAITAYPFYKMFCWKIQYPHLIISFENCYPVSEHNNNLICIHLTTNQKREMQTGICPLNQVVIVPLFLPKWSWSRAELDVFLTAN